MKIYKLLLLGFAGAALAVIAKRLITVERDTAHEDLNFDADFIPGSKKLNLDIPEHINPSWFRAPQRHAEDSDAMFI
jgi:hypothetical protein